MQRSIALLQFTRSIAASHAGDIGAASASRLLSNSQASTSAVHSQVRNARSVSDASHRPHRPPRTSDSNQRDRYGGQAGQDERSSDPGDARSSDASPPRQPGTFSEPVPEPQVGFVADGAYPYSPEEVEIVNVAGSTETAWEFLGSNDEESITWFGMDFTRGKLPEVERNALLSDSTKEMMYQMHAHDKAK